VRPQFSPRVFFIDTPKDKCFYICKYVHSKGCLMKQILLTPEAEQVQRLTRDFWHQTDIGTIRSMLFIGVKNVLAELRFGQYGCEYDTPLTDEEAVWAFRKKLAVFTRVDGTAAQDLLRIFRLIPWQEGVTCTVFIWFSKEGEAGRMFFQEHGVDPNCFIARADLDLAIELAQLQQWEAVEAVNQNRD
jgi:hypothetical protein